MSVSRKRALDYAESIIARPRARVPLTLRHGKCGVTLLHKGRAVTRCYITPSGIRAATFMAKALGVRVPPMGSSVQAQVSTGVLWRAISISSLDFRKEEAYHLVERLLEEAQMMRGAGSEEA